MLQEHVMPLEDTRKHWLNAGKFTCTNKHTDATVESYVQLSTLKCVLQLTVTHGQARVSNETAKEPKGRQRIDERRCAGSTKVNGKFT